MRFSVRFNNDLPVSAYPPLARAAEEAGFDQFWVSDDLFLRSVWVILSAVAAATERIGIGTCIVNPYTMHPAEMAMAAGALDELCHGRLSLGLSAGASDFLKWVGIATERPLTAVVETVDALRRLFRGAAPAPAGTFLREWTTEAYLRFPTRQIPIYIGAMSPRMLRAVGRLADGGLPLLFPPEHFAAAYGYIREGLAESRRTIDQVDVAACIWCSVDTDRQAAEAALRDKVAYYGHALSPTILLALGVERAAFEPIQRAIMVERDVRRARALVTPAMLRIGVVGTAADLIRRLEGLVAMGARHLSFGPPLGPDPLAAIQLLGRDVLPYFR
ncbi:MAG: LLM class flavin-dependent oxidoreductase [Chloroflexi bacterium]|nr:LLM class flavin-dependent oxidoreductase [Chloroflexota bacterium]